VTCTLPSGCAAATSTTAREPAQRRGGVESVMRAAKIAVASATGRVEGHVVDVLEVRGHATLAGPTLEQWLDTAAVVPR
jgi:hypothetical protein